MNRNDSKKTPNLSLFVESLQTRKMDSTLNVACVFDIDSTLFCVSSRTQAILRKLSQEKIFSEQFPDLSNALSSIQVEPFDWGLRAPIERLGLTVTKEASEKMRQFWRKNFFSNDFLQHDSIYPQSNEFVKLCQKLGSKIFYLTGRNEAEMKLGTLNQLSQHEFPLSSSSHLMMKTSEEVEDEDFKLNRLKGMVGSFDKIYFFENEPVIIDSIFKALPEIEIIFMDSTHSNRSSSPSHLLKVTPESFAELFNL